jgi:cell division protein FtsB
MIIKIILILLVIFILYSSTKLLANFQASTIEDLEENLSTQASNLAQLRRNRIDLQSRISDLSNIILN